MIDTTKFSNMSERVSRKRGAQTGDGEHEGEGDQAVDGAGPGGSGSVGNLQPQRKRRSRFDSSTEGDGNYSSMSDPPEALVSNTIGSGVGPGLGTGTGPVVSPSSTITDIQAQIAAQIASVTSILQSTKRAGTGTGVEQVQKRILRLDSQGREIDEKGNVIKVTGPVKTLAANVAENYANKKKENPYLSSVKLDEEEELDSVDSRIKLANRDIKAKKAFNFIEAGILLSPSTSSYYSYNDYYKPNLNPIPNPNRRHLCEAGRLNKTQRRAQSHRWVCLWKESP